MKTAKLSTLYYEIGIRPHYAGFGMYDIDPNGLSAADGYGDPSDILAHCDEAVELTDGGGSLPDGVEDIRGRIYNQPRHVYAVRHGEYWSYMGIAARDTWCDEQTGQGIIIDCHDASSRLQDAGYTKK